MKDIRYCKSELRRLLRKQGGDPVFHAEFDRLRGDMPPKQFKKLFVAWLLLSQDACGAPRNKGLGKRFAELETVFLKRTDG